MSSWSDKNSSPHFSSEKQISHQGSRESIITLFILVAASLFLVAGIFITVIAYGFQGDVLVKTIGMISGIILVAVSVGLHAYALRVMADIRRRQLYVETAMNAVEDGDLTTRLAYADDGVSDPLARAFNTMAESLEENTNQMRFERNRFRSIHQGITDGIIVFDTHGHVISANPAAESAIGLLEKQIRGTGHIGITEIEQIVNSPDIVPDELKIKCWIAKKCDHRECPSFESDDLRCWLQCGTFCHDEIQGTFRQKRDACERCDVYQINGIRVDEHERAGRHYSVTVSPILNNSGLEEGRMAVFHDVTALVSAGESLKRRNLELTVLNEVGSAFSESFDDIEVVLEEALASVAHAIGVTAGAILLREEDGSALRLAAHMGISPQASVFIQLLDLSDKLDEFLDSRTGLVDVDALFRRHRSVQMMISREGFRKPVMLPIMAKGDLIGLLILMDVVREEYHEADIRLLRSLASQVSVATQNQGFLHSIAKARKAWETTFDSMTDGVSVHDTNFRIVHANRAMAEMLGATKAELVGSTCHKAIHHSRLPLIQCPQNEVMKNRKPLSIEIEEPAFNKFFRLTVNPVFDDDGTIVGLVHVMRDITERKLLREQLLQSEKLAAVGKLVSGVAHEINNPLTGIIGYAQLMLRKSESGVQHPSPAYINSILAEAQRASRIVQNLLSFSRKHQPQKIQVDINQVIHSVLDLRAYEMRLSGITVETRLDASEPGIMADLHQIEQVILNLVNNAVQAVADSGHKGVIGIVTRDDGDKVFIVVTDNGDGISYEDQGRIFDPFFTTRDVGTGTGLGLSICYGIVEEHGGSIRVESRKGSGTTMTVELPAVRHRLENITDDKSKAAAK